MTSLILIYRDTNDNRKLDTFSLYQLQTSIVTNQMKLGAEIMTNTDFSFEIPV